MESIHSALKALGKYVAPETVTLLEEPLKHLRKEYQLEIELLEGPDQDNPKDYANFRLKATQLEPTGTGQIFI